MKTNQERYPIATMCRLLGVSSSGYQGTAPPAALGAAAAGRGAYGADPTAPPGLGGHLGKPAAPPRAGRQARAQRPQAGGAADARRQWARTARREPQARPASELVQRDFTAAGPYQRWVADITGIPTEDGLLHLATVLDVWSRRLVGWVTATTGAASWCCRPRGRAMAQGQADGVIHHSDQGCPYPSHAFTQRCTEVGVTRSMGSVGGACDNATAESFFVALKCEPVHRCRFPAIAAAQQAVCEYIEGWCSA